jgi:hypothetical protein
MSGPAGNSVLKAWHAFEDASIPRQPKAGPSIPVGMMAQCGNDPMKAEAIDAATLALEKTRCERAPGGETMVHLAARRCQPDQIH